MAKGMCGCRPLLLVLMATGCTRPRAGGWSQLRDAMQLNALEGLTHMAAAPAGRSCVAAAGCLPRWLPLCTRLHAQVMQMLLMLPLSCQTDWTRTKYFQPLYRNLGISWLRLKDDIGTKGFDTKGYADSCPQELKRQVC
jgi:hypothetical protein